MIDEHLFMKQCFIQKIHIALYGSRSNDKTISRRDARKVMSYVRFNQQELNKLIDIMIQLKLIERVGQEFVKVNPPKLDDVWDNITLKKKRTII